MKRPIAEREQVVSAFVKQEIGKDTAAQLLGCTKRTLETYVKGYLGFKTAGLVDHRSSNNHKLSSSQIDKIVSLKKAETWRSARNIRDYLDLSVHERTIWKILVKANLTRVNLKRVKAIVRFEALAPNDLWQTDIMGKIDFSKIGILYLIAALDDHSRFVPYGRWFKTQGKMNVFFCLVSIPVFLWSPYQDAPRRRRSIQSQNQIWKR